MLVGAHVSVAKGYLEALEYAQSVGCECLQFFAKSPRQWRGAAIAQDTADAFALARREAGFGPVFTHTAYLINLSTDNEELRLKSVAALADELIRGARLGVSGVVTHIGNDPAGDLGGAARRAADSVARAFDLAGDAGAAARLLLENTAGAGRTFGGSFEEIAAVIEGVDAPQERLGVCLDTCHAFAYGFDVSTFDGWEGVARSLDEAIGAGRLGLIHANDCMFDRGSRRDRHAWIGDGLIGADGFRAMMCAPLLRAACVVTEMPGDVPEKDAVNIGRLVAMRDECRGAQ